jgi:hypothetical protein
MPKLLPSADLSAMGSVHSFKSPAIAEDIARYSCLRLVKHELYLYLASAIAVLEVICYIPLAGDLKPWVSHIDMDFQCDVCIPA